MGIVSVVVVVSVDVGVIVVVGVVGAWILVMLSAV